uniref:Uncharacterized protein n=1 Tax=viral metagenome TaxID=1070528 RepID=A0A6C0C1E3_9ZZZZ
MAANLRNYLRTKVTTPRTVAEDTRALKRCVFCRNSTGSDLVWNRDSNASLNIVGIYLRLVATGRRPAEFQMKK